MDDEYHLLISHFNPVKPLLQAHVKVFTPSVHDPPFWHGLLAQSLISEIKMFQRINDEGHSRTQTVWSSSRAKIIGFGKGYSHM